MRGIRLKRSHRRSLEWCEGRESGQCRPQRLWRAPRLFCGVMNIGCASGIQRCGAIKVAERCQANEVRSIDQLFANSGEKSPFDLPNCRPMSSVVVTSAPLR